MTRNEIMAGMSSQSALDMVVNQMHKGPAVATLIQALSKNNLTVQATLRGAQKKNFEQATEELNKMTREAQERLDDETQRCLSEETSMTDQLEWLQDQVRRHNAEAASARAAVIIAQGNIKTLEENLRLTILRFEQHKRDCIRELQEMHDELLLVLNDVDVMNVIIGLIDCSGGSGDEEDFLQTGGLVQCAHCGNTIMLQHGQIQQALSKLQTQVAKGLLANGVKSGIFTAGGFKGWNATEMPVGGVNVSDVPVAPVPFDCKPTTKCTIGGNPNCQKLLDRFLVCQAGVMDRKAELEESIFDKQTYCEMESGKYQEQISGVNTRLRKERGDLAEGTRRQNENEEGSHQKSSQHAAVAARYTTEMRLCCDNKNDARSELCALEKIRGEVAKIQNSDNYFVDCAVSDWSNEECSVTCGGGVMKRARSIITQAQGGGVQCPPLTALVKCNDEECPMDCRLNDWEGWSGCSAECGGGVRERARTVFQEALTGGDPCEDTEEEEGCKIQACDTPCVLSPWGDWSSCSKMCGRGTQRRTKSIAQVATGSGECADEQDPERMAFTPCNDFDCGDAPLKCESKVDVIILLDSSASLGEDGWTASHHLAGKLMEALGSGDNVQAKVALEVFGGPKTWADYDLCVLQSSTPLTTGDMEGKCGIKWIGGRFQEGDAIKTMGVEVKDWGSEQWLRSTTLTSVALGQADDQLYYGREDANSVVIVITDGWPMSQRNTKRAAKKLQEHAKVIWVPVTRSAPIKMIQKMASLPAEDHVIEISDFAELETVGALNRIISTTCPKISSR